MEITEKELEALLRAWGIEQNMKQILKGPREDCLSVNEMVPVVRESLRMKEEKGKIDFSSLPQHLRECPACTNDLLVALQADREETLPNPPEGFADRMMEALLAHQDRRSS